MSSLMKAGSAAEFLKVCQWVHGRGWTPATAGNFSMRLPENCCAVSGSGLDKGQLNADDFLEIGISDGKVQGPAGTKLRPSAETILHTTLYQLFPHCQVVLHNHSVANNVLSYVESASELVLEDWELLKVLKGISTHKTKVIIPLIDNDQDMDIIAEKLRAMQKGPLEKRLTHAFILRGHGMYTWGETPQAAQQSLEGLEFLLACLLEIKKISRA
jgi:methylthioribulose-1-phosphate dehydratase